MDGNFDLKTALDKMRKNITTGHSCSLILEIGPTFLQM